MTGVVVRSLHSEELTQFTALFRGRTDAWGHGEDARSIKHPVTPAVWWGHLYGDRPIGIYNMLPNATCWWSAIDLDAEDLEPVHDVVKAYRLFGAHPYVERSRAKGWHVWVFHDRPMPIALARHAGQGVLAVLDLPPLTEVYPKQERLDPEKPYGNYLRLPYCRREDGIHRRIVVDGEALSLAEFLSTVQRTGQEPLERLAALAPAPIVRTASKAAAAIEAAMGGIPGGLASRQRISAVAAGTARLAEGERDTGFYTLAKFLHGIGKTEAEAEEIVLRVHAHQMDGHFAQSAALDKVRRAYR